MVKNECGKVKKVCSRMRSAKGVTVYQILCLSPSTDSSMETPRYRLTHNLL